MRFRITVLAATAMTGVAGCVSIPPDRGAADVEALVNARSATERVVPLQPLAEDQSGALLASLLAQPVGPEEAVRIALLRNPDMLRLYAELGLAQADVHDASRVANPGVSFLRLSPAATGDGVRTTWSLTQHFMGLIFLRYRTRNGQAELLRVKQHVAHEVLRMEADVRKAWYDDIGAQLAARMQSGAATAASLAADLAVRFHEAGNISALQRAQEEAAAAAVLIDRRRAQTKATATRAELLTILGLPVDQQVVFAEELPLPGSLGIATGELQAQGLRQRLDVEARRTEVAYLREQLTHVSRWRWLGGLTVGVEHEKEVDGSTLRGGGAAVDLPVFNAGGGSRLRAQTALEAAEASLKLLELRTTNDIAVQRAAVDAARETVDDYRLRLAPLRERIVTLIQERQNFMLVGAFELLAARREEIETISRYIEAVRDYWIARTELIRTLGGAWPEPDSSRSLLEVPTLPEPAADVRAAPAATGEVQ